MSLRLKSLGGEESNQVEVESNQVGNQVEEKSNQVEGKSNQVGNQVEGKSNQVEGKSNQVVNEVHDKSNQVEDHNTGLGHSDTDSDTGLRHSNTNLDTQLRHSDTKKVSLSNKQRDIVNFCSSNHRRNHGTPWFIQSNQEP